jgi:bifunctional non-homologous end joining protein LigD
VKREAVAVVVDGRQLTLTTLDKVMYPATGFTKAQVIDYYQRIAPAILTHLQGRQVTRKRWPHGVAGPSFFEKNAPAGTPGWVRRSVMKHYEDAIDLVVCDDKPTLVWLANLNALELHPQLHLASDQDTPTCVVFDLDPGLPAALLECCEAALTLRAVFAELDLQAWPKVSGGKGLQVYVPLNTPATYEATKGFAHGIARLLEQHAPDRFVSRMPKDLRKGKVFVDWSQNDAIKTTIGVYSLRGNERPTVSTPLAWREVEQAVEAQDAGALVFEPEDVLRRVAKQGDLFAPVASLRQELPDLAA